jgi:uncharacterized protein
VHRRCLARHGGGAFSGKDLTKTEVLQIPSTLVSDESLLLTPAGTEEIEIEVADTGTGGMPSSHAASVSALSTAVGLQDGWDSPLFGVAAFVSLVIMYDAAGIRRAAGLQAEILNRMLEDLREHHTFEGERLKELLGHTPIEVVVGAALGIGLAVLLYP